MYNPDYHIVRNSSTSDKQIMFCGLIADTIYAYKVRSMVGSDYSDFVLDNFTTFLNGEQLCNMPNNVRMCSVHGYASYINNKRTSLQIQTCVHLKDFPIKC